MIRQGGCRSILGKTFLGIVTADRSMPFTVVESNDPIAELDRRYDDVLRELDDLDRRVEQALRDFAAVQKDTAERFGRKQKAAA